MKISCDIIKDILPLYVEEMVSDATRELVDGHLAECEGCTKELEALRKPQTLPAETDTSGLKRVSRIVHRKSILSAAAAALVLLSVVFWLWAFMNVPVYLDVEDAVKSVYQAENGAVVIDYYDYVRGSVGITQPGYTQGQICYTTRWDMLSLRFGWSDRVFDRKMVGGTTWWETDDGRKVIIQADEDTALEDIVSQGTDKSWWYLDYRTGKADTVLWDAGEAAPTGKLALVSADLTIPVLAAALLDVLALMAQRKKVRWKAVLCYCSILCGAYFASVLLITAGQTIVYSQSIEQLSYICVLTVLLSATASVFRKLRKINRS